MNENYVGKIVVVDLPDSYPRVSEVVVVRQTPHTIYGVSTAGGYGSHEVRAFSLAGPKPVTILSVAQDVKAVRLLADDLEYFANTKNRGEKPQWIESVYTGARASARLVRSTLKEGGEASLGFGETKTVEVAGVSLTIRVEHKTSSL